MVRNYISKRKETIVLAFRKRVDYFELRERAQQSNRDGFVKEIWIPLNSWFSTHGLQLNKVELGRLSNNNEAISAEEMDKQLKKQIIIDDSSARSAPDLDFDVICSRARDAANISERGWSKLRKAVNPSLKTPLRSTHGTNRYNKLMKAFYTIHPNRFGYYCEPIEKLQFVLEKVFILLGRKLANDTFDLAIFGDGMVVTDTFISTVCFTFKVLNESNLGVSGVYTIGEFYKNYFIGIPHILASKDLSLSINQHF